MKGYRIIWRGQVYGESFVNAETAEEARGLALNDGDENFEQYDPDVDWEVDEITELTDQTKIKGEQNK